MEHTKGKWEVGTYRYGEIWVGANFHIATCHRGSVSEEKCQANAQLIAAAPDLLATLKNAPTKLASETLEQFHNAYTSWRRTDLQQAIAKAEKS